MDALILVGGQGTRIRSVLGDLPKPLAPIAGRSFLSWQMQWLTSLGVTRFILAVGYRQDVLMEAVGSNFAGYPIHYSTESYPLGTGGAVLNALDFIHEERLLVLNGDSMAAVSMQGLWQCQADVALVGVQVDDMGRYGALEFDPNSGRLYGFAEKGRQGPGCINAGVYVMRRDFLLGYRNQQRPCSLEQDILRSGLDSAVMRVCPVQGFFIDVGIPEDYALAQSLIPDFVQNACSEIV